MKKHHATDHRWTKSYLLDGSSVRRLGERWDVGYVTAWRRIQRTLNASVDVGELIHPRMSSDISIIILDAKHFKVRRNPYTLYVCLNVSDSRPIAFILLPRHETREGYDHILSFLWYKRVNVLAIVSDADQSIKSSVHDYYPHAVHQKCAFHVLQKAFLKLNGRNLIQTDRGRRLWEVIRKIVLGYEDERQARSYLLKVEKKYPKYLKTWKILGDHLHGVYEFTKRRDLPIPRTSNQIENFMGRIEQRLKVFRSAKNATSLVRIITEFIKLKFKRPTRK